jgi:hypothetical protein
MRVYIVLKNGMVDEIFDLYHCAVKHCEHLQKKWNITKIIERNLNSFESYAETTDPRHTGLPHK